MELATPGSAVRHASVARHITDCATRPGVVISYSFSPSNLLTIKVCHSAIVFFAQKMLIIIFLGRNSLITGNSHSAIRLT